LLAKGFTGVRTVGVGAACALWIACVCASPASAKQQNPGDTAAGSSSTQKSSTSKAKTSRKRRHKASSSSSSKSGSTSGKVKWSSSRRSKTARGKGQKKIDTERAQAIQEALIREHYLSGEASGTWNQASEDAMRKYQSDHGWQSKTVPDSRALIQLGLGPSHDHLLNPESAMTSGPDTHAQATPAPARPNAPTDSHGERAPAPTTPANTPVLPLANPPHSADSPQ
jgi:hypothetical protein